MTKMGAMAIFGKKPSQIFSGTTGPIITKFGVQHFGLRSIIVCSNDDPGLNVT